MGAKKKNNNKRKQKQPQKAQEVKEIEKSGTASEIVPQVEPESISAPTPDPAASQLEVNVLDQIDWKEIEQDELSSKNASSQAPIAEYSELSHAIDESDPDEQGIELVHELGGTPEPIPEVSEPAEVNDVAGSVTPPIGEANLEEPVTEGDFFDQLDEAAAAETKSTSHALESSEKAVPSPKAQVESAIKSLARESIIETPVQPKQAHEVGTLELEAPNTESAIQVEQQEPQERVDSPEADAAEEYSKATTADDATNAADETVQEPEPQEITNPVEDAEVPREAEQDPAVESDFFTQIAEERTRVEPSSSPLEKEVQDQQADFFDKIGEEDQPKVDEGPVKEQEDNQEDVGAKAEEDFFEKAGDSTEKDFFDEISSSPVKETHQVEQPKEDPKPKELKPAASTLNLNFDDDDDFLESDDEPTTRVPAQGAPKVSEAAAPATLAFLEADDDLLSDDEDEIPLATTATKEAPANTRTVRPTQSLHFDTGKRGFDLPTELMSKTKVQTRRAPGIVRPPTEQPQPLPKPSQYAPPASAPPGPMAPPKTPVNPYAALPKQSPKQPVTKPIVPNVPEHILPPKAAISASSAGGMPNPYAAAQQVPPKASPYAPKPVVGQTAQASPYAPGPAQNTQYPAQVQSKPPAGPVPSSSVPHGAAPPKKSASKYQRSADKDPYGFPELKTTAAAPRSRSSMNRVQGTNAPLPTPNVTDFNVSYQQQRAQVGDLAQGAGSIPGQVPPPSAPGAPYQQPYPAGIPVEASHGASKTPAATFNEKETFSKQSMAPPSAAPMGPPRANPYAPSAPASGRTTPLKPPTGLKSPRKGSLQSTPSESPYTELHLSRPPSELGQYAPPPVPQGHVPVHPAHMSKSAATTSSTTPVAPVVQNTSNASALDDRLRRQIPVFSWSKESVVSAVPPVISYGQNTGTTITITSIKSHSLISETEAKYPGPLVNSKGAIKNKKKEMEKWTAEMASNAQEHQLLWRLMEIFVKELPQENESKEIQNLLDPTVASSAKGSQLKSAADLFEAGKKISGHSRQGSTQLQGIFDQIQQGARDAALQTAIENREWAHALILAFSEGDDAWDSVVKEFVRIELRSQGTPSSQQLAFAYRVFAGSGSNAVDELRPLRSSTANDAAPSLEANLANWKNYVAVIMANRSKNDVHALARLGELLVGNGQVEAGHFCLILSGTAAFGTDSMPALGVASASGHNLSSMLLSEVYEYVLLTRKTIALPLSQLVVHKAALGGMFADCGYISEGSKLSEAALVLARALRTPEILQICEKMNQRCAADAGAGWISRKLSRPRLDKMFGSSFNKFVSGEDTIEEEQSQQPPQLPQQHNRPSSAGPYGQSHAGYTPGPGMPSVSESRSSTPGAYDHYRVASPNVPVQPSATFDMHSNFAPQGQYGMPQSYQSNPNMQTYGHPGQYSTPGTPSPYAPQQSQAAGYAPQPPLPPASGYTPQPPQPPQPPQGYAPSYNSYAPIAGPGAAYTAPNAYNPQYSAPQGNQYAPPAPEPQAEPEPVKEEPKQENKKKEDKKKKKDTKEDKGDKKGWFGGWFGKGDEKDGKPVKAKLDSGSTFYYDEKLGKWVNKDGPPPEETKPVAPPPMKKKPAAPAAPAAPASAPAPAPAPAGPASVPVVAHPAAAPMTAPTSAPPNNATVPGIAPPGAPNAPPVSSATAPLPRAKARGSIDALLDGPPTAGTRKKRNARNRYVDVTQQ